LDSFRSNNFAPGPHVFSATWWTAKHAKSGAHVTLNLAANAHYFIETFLLNTNFLGAVKIYINGVTCEGAQKENVSSKPLEPTHLTPDGIPMSVTVFAEAVGHDFPLSWRDQNYSRKVESRQLYCGAEVAHCKPFTAFRMTGRQNE